jgi:Protein of unknown function (DUF4058)
MPLLDHFHPPLHPVRHWESFHAQWAGSIANAVNGVLPPGYFAETQLHVGSRVEVDVATWDLTTAQPGNGPGGAATATLPARVWAPPAAAMTMPATFPDSLEVLVFNTEAGPTLVAAVELASPGNKDRPETRRAFAAKCASYLQQGIGLLIADIVTSRHAQLHNELIRLMETGDQFLLPPDPLYAVAYRPYRRKEAELIDVWPATLAVGQALPVMPLPLDKGLIVPVDLEATYTEARQRSRL